MIAHPRPLAAPGLLHPTHNRTAFNILVNVYEPLVERGPNLSLRPAVAESWYSPDPRTWVFKLRRGVRRHDGRLLTAADVVASFERYLGDAWAAGLLAPVSGVRAGGEGEVVFTTREPADTLAARLTLLPIAGLPESGGGTGPYRYRSWSKDGPVVLEAFPEYHGGRPSIPVVEFRIVPDARERAERLLSGEVQLVEDVLPVDMPALRAARGVRTIAMPGFLTFFLVMDTARERTPFVDQPKNPFRDPRVREALDRAVDRKALAAGPLLGYGEPTTQLAAPGQVGFSDALEIPLPDPAVARRLLREAGYPAGFAVPLDYTAGILDEVVEVVARQLGAAGVRVRPRAADVGEFLSRVESRDTSFYFMRWIQPSQEIHETYTWLLHSPRESFGTMNGGGYSNARLDRLLEISAHERRETERASLLREATALIHAERPILPLFRQHDLYAFSKDLDFRPEPQQQFGTILRRMRWKS